MAAMHHRSAAASLHPLNAILLAFPVVLFAGALLSDYAYWASYQIQWTNFSSWLIAGGLAVGAFALLWAIVGLLRHRGARRGRPLWYALLLLAAWLLGFVNALIHARDAWAAMPAGLILSAIVALLTLAAAWIGYSGLPRGEPR